MNKPNNTTAFPKIAGVITAILIFTTLLPVVLNGVSSFSSIGIFLIMGPAFAAIIGGVIVAGIFQFIADLFK